MSNINAKNKEETKAFAAILLNATVKELRAIAKDPAQTATNKFRATWYANRMEGTVSNTPTPKQLRARLLGQISFYLLGTVGQLGNVISQAHSIAGKSDMSKDQEAQLWCALKLASITTKDVILIAARINKENKEKKHE